MQSTSNLDGKPTRAGGVMKSGGVMKMCYALTPTLVEKINAYADAHDLSRSQVIRRSVEMFFRLMEPTS